MSPRRFGLLAAAVGGVVALAVTFPLAFRLRSQVLEDGSFDAFQFLWNVWWARQSLVATPANPFHTHHLFFPDGASLVFHTLSLSLGLLSLPLQAAFGLVAAHNLLVLVMPALAVVSMALLAREVVGDPWAALAAGLAFALTPIAIYFLPVLYLGCSCLIALMAWVWWRMHRRRRVGDVVLGLAILAALVFASQEYAMMALAVLALDSACRLVAPRWLGMPSAWVAGTLAFWGVTAVGLGAVVLMALAAPGTLPPSGQVFLGSAAVAGLLVPPWVKSPPGLFWTITYLGTAPLLLWVVALAGGDRHARFWLLAAALLAALALGPYIHWVHPSPGLQPLPEEVARAGFPGPYLLAMRVVPFLEFFRAPYRWVVATQVALGVTTACGVATLRTWARSGAGRRRVTVAVFVALAFLGMLDARGLRAPLASARIPPALEVLAADREPSAILELPAGMPEGTLATFSSVYMYYQTRHGKFLLDGTVARLPPGQRRLAERDVVALAAAPYVKYVVIHRDLARRAPGPARAQIAAVERLVASTGILVARDDATDVYRLGTFRADDPSLTALRRGR